MENKGIVNIKTGHIYPHPDNPRKNLGDLSELIESIKKNGIMQNLTVIPHDVNPSEYIAIIGHRRHAAALQAGLEEVPCRVIEGMTAREQVSMMLEENMQRNDLTIYEQAQGFQMMMDLGETEETIADKTSFSKTTIRHRLNIAKLDQKVLQKKEQDNGFQLTLKDLYELEKVADIKTRDRILKEANNSREIIWKAQNAVNEAEREKNTKQIVTILKALGVEPAPKSAENEQYSGKWEVIKEFSLEKEPPKQIKLNKLKDTKGIYYLLHYRSVRVIKKAAKGQKVLTSEELKRKQKDKNIKEIKAKIKELSAERRDFIYSIVSGKIDAVKNEEEIRKQIWEFFFEVGTGLYMSTQRSFFTGKNDYECKQEEREDADKKVADLSFTNSMIVSMHFAVGSVRDIVDWQGHFVPEVGKQMQHAYEILKPYGWIFVNQDAEQLLNGTHELYMNAGE